MRYTIRTFVILFLLLANLTARAQTYFFDNYGVSDGLAQSLVYCMVQDKNHLLWLGTKSGVSTFDGMNFKNYSYEDGLSQNGVQSILQDRTGNIWMGHVGGGLSLFRNHHFERILLPGDTLTGDITTLLEGPDGSIWIGTYRAGAIRLFNPWEESSRFRFSSMKGNDLSDQVFGSYKDQAGLVYLITDLGIKKFNPDSNRFNNFLPPGLTNYFNKTCILEDSRGDFWFGTYNGGLYQYLCREKKFIIYDHRDGLANNWISALMEDRDGNIWAATWGGGITRIHGHELKTYNTRNGLQDDKIRCMMPDAEGNILLGTYEHGLSVFKGEKFITYGKTDGLIDQQVWAIYQDHQGAFWFGTNGGITVYNPARPANNQFHYFTRSTHNLSSNLIRFIREDQQQHLWFGTAGGGIFSYNPENRRFFYDPALNNFLTGDLIVTGLAIDRKNHLWAGTNDGLVYFEIDQRKGTRTSVKSLDRNEISCLYLDHDDHLWIGSRGKGITRYDDQEQTFTILHSFDQITPRCFSEDDKKRMWVGTESQGVYMMENDSVVLHLTEQDGLLANYISLIQPDCEGKICIGTNKGLNLFDPDSRLIRSFTERSGFTGIETKDNAVFRESDSAVWFGTVRGAVLYQPVKEKLQTLQPLTTISRLRINYKDYPLENGIKLSHSENSILFDYYSVCLTDPDAVEYQVKLEGLEKSWEPPTRQAFINYPPLPPGNYRFLLRARNASGVWNDPPLEYSFRILPPFYQTWWFILGCILAGSGGILLYIRLREKSLVHEKWLLEEKVKERTLEITHKNNELESKNKDITDSIIYAERIQHALLPPEIPFDNTFVLYMPKAIVSGDFYWMMDLGDKQYMAAIDCTGHGVPGAFMSIIGYTSLNKIVREYRISEPGSILEHLNIEVTLALNQKKDQWNINDGMDISLLAVHKHASVFEFAGAMSSMVLIRDNQLTEIRGDRYAIGRLTGADKRFENHQLELRPGDQIYLFSDGYSDQFGGKEGKKFKSSRLKNLLLEIHSRSMPDQKEALIKNLQDWKGNLDQNDDILVIGRKF